MHRAVLPVPGLQEGPCCPGPCLAAPVPRAFRLGSAPAARARRSGYLRYSEHFLGFIVFPSLSHLPRRKPSVPAELAELAAPCPAGRHSRPALHHAVGRRMASAPAFPLPNGGSRQQRSPGGTGQWDHALRPPALPGHSWAQPTAPHTHRAEPLLQPCPCRWPPQCAGVRVYWDPAAPGSPCAPFPHLAAALPCHARGRAHSHGSGSILASRLGRQEQDPQQRAGDAKQAGACPATSLGRGGCAGPPTL